MYRVLSVKGGRTDGGARKCREYSFRGLEGRDNRGGINRSVINRKVVALDSGGDKDCATDTGGAKKWNTDGILAFNNGGRNSNTSEAC